MQAASTSDGSLPSRWAFLRPWWRILQAAHALIEPQRRLASLQFDCRALRLVVTRPPTASLDPTTHMIHELRDALEIILLAAQLNSTVVWSMARQYCRLGRFYRELTWQDIHPDETFPMEIKLDVTEIPAPTKHERHQIAFGATPYVEAVFAAFFTPVPLQERSSEFRRARQSVLEQIPRDDHRTLRVCDELCVEINCMLRDDQVEVSLIRQLVSWRRQSHEQDLAQPRSVMRVGVVSIEPVCSMDESVLSLIRQIRALIELRSVPAIRQNGQALMHSRDVHDVSVARTPDLLWTLHMLFSSTCTHRIRRVQLKDVHLGNHAIYILQQYRQSRNPMALLHNTQLWGRTFQPSFNTQKKLQLEPKQFEGGEGTVLQFKKFGLRCSNGVVSERTLFDVTAECDTYIHVLAPGFGVCRVDRDCNRKTTPHVAAKSLSNLDKHGVKAFNLRLASTYRESEQQDLNIRFVIQQIGFPLEELALECTFANGDEALNAILTSCPRLKMLSIMRLTLSRFATIVEAYQSGTCGLKSLELLSISIQDNGSLKSLIAESSNRTTRMATLLEELSLSFVNPTLPSEDDMNLFTELLTANRCLRYLSLGVSNDRYDTISPRFAEYDNTVVSGVSDAHDRSYIYAFLSVIDNMNGQASSTSSAVADAIVTLDSQALSIIFGFAMKPVVRTVIVRNISGWQWVR